MARVILKMILFVSSHKNLISSGGEMVHRIDDYINKSNLSKQDLQFLYLSPIKMIAYGAKGRMDYDVIREHLALVQRMCKRSDKDTIFYIIDQTGLTNWEKFKLKFSYCYL